MRVILQEKIASLGDVGDEVTVKRGFARNYLIPQDKVILATKENKTIFEKRRAELERVSATRLAEAKKRAKGLEKLSITIAAQAGEEGKLFGSVGPREVAEAITKAGQEVVKSEVDMPEGPIRHTGKFKVHLIFHSEVHQTITVEVVATTT